MSLRLIYSHGKNPKVCDRDDQLVLFYPFIEEELVSYITVLIRIISSRNWAYLSRNTENSARFYASKRDTWHKSERALPEAEGGGPRRSASWRETHWSLTCER